MKIAISGKGGVGKTTVSAFLIKALAERGRDVLAIDADPSPHLARALGFKGADAIIPIAEMRELLQERSERDGPFYRLNPRVSDLPERFMLKEGNVKLMVLGAIREGGGGCACADNVVLKTLLNTLFLGSDEDIVLDMEAGVEHLGRGTIKAVDHLLVVVQPYLGSLKTAIKIKALAHDLGIRDIMVIANNIKGSNDLSYIKEHLDADPVGIFYASDEVIAAERASMPIYETSPGLKASAKEVIKRLLEEDV
ncbi:MAG: ATP-binding protein [Dissulfurimicrobium sp.]|uniref:ATP-binding protein n=1 Tax=Dissulfurimicrobium sp. TaxID=2022436 RepID=UPI00404B2654